MASKLRILLLLSVAGWIVGDARGQDFRRYQPRTPRNTEGQSRLPDEPADATGDPTVLVAKLNALVFLDSPEAVATELLEAAGINVRGDLALLESGEFQRIAESYLGTPISIRRLNELVRDVILFYRDNDLPVVDVSVPEQKISNGVVQIVVREGRIGDVRVAGARWFDPGMLVDQTWIWPGDQIYESELLDELRWLNRNPFREVDLELNPGELPGTTDVIFNVDDRLPISVYAGYEDTGNRSTGLERTIYGFSWGNALWRDHQFAYQFTASSDFTSVEAHSGIYSIPLHNRDTLTFLGSYAEVESLAEPVLNRGRAVQASLRYNYELRKCPRLNDRLVVGFDYKRTNTNLEFGGAAVFNNSVDIAQIVLGYQRSQSDCWGGTVLTADVVMSPGQFSSGNTDPRFQQQRFAATADYYYGRLRIERLVLLPRFLQFFARFEGQLADGNLLPPEQLGFGGFDLIRGYDYRLVNGDSGYRVNLELQTQPVSLYCDDEFQALLFCDFGDAYNHTLLPGEDPSVDLSSIGAGFRYRASDLLTIRFDYGVQLATVAFQPKPSQRVHLGVVVSR